MQIRKKELLTKLATHELTECHQYFQLLFEVLIQEARERNDTAVKEDLYRNQGAVKELKQLLKSTKRHEIKRGFDGGYGD